MNVCLEGSNPSFSAYQAVCGCRDGARGRGGVTANRRPGRHLNRLLRVSLNMRGLRRRVLRLGVAAWLWVLAAILAGIVIGLHLG